MTGNIIITGKGVRVYQAVVIRSALNLYIRMGIKANTAYTPKNMLATAEAITGRSFSKATQDTLYGRMALAVEALTAWIDAQGPNLDVEGES